MAIKWNKLKCEIYIRNATIVLGIITLFLLGSVFSDMVSYDYSSFKTKLLMLAVNLLLVVIISYRYLLFDKQFIEKEYEDYCLRLKKYVKSQQIVIIIYYVMVLAILNVSFDGGYSTFYTDLRSYRMTHILMVLIIIIPLVHEFTILFNYYIRVNVSKKNLVKLSKMIDQIEKESVLIENLFTNEEQYYRYGEKLVNMTSVMQNTAEERVKSEKMKVDLITNVSHDLKTPLTAIINYIELIKREDLSPVLTDYVEVLSRKADKLKEMILSLFELAKTTSGNVDLNIEIIDGHRLIEQIVADVEELTREKNKDIRLSLSTKDTKFLADSAYMYLVVQNLLINAISYSLDHTRIYIKTYVDSGKVRIELLNTANYEMNFTKDDIVSRFVRGDESRSSDGNGLGLAIAKTYTEACGGAFDISIDGDQFRATITFDAVSGEK